MSNIPPRLLAQVQTQRSALPLVIPPLTTTALCKTHLGNFIDLLALDETDASQRGLWFDQMGPAARLSILAHLTAIESAIV